MTGARHGHNVRMDDFTEFLHTLRVWDLPELPQFDPDSAPDAPLPSSGSGCAPPPLPGSPSRTP